MKNKGLFFFACLLLIIVVTACDTLSVKKRRGDQGVVARFKDRTLYYTDLAHIYHPGINKQDSIEMSRNFINKWLVKQLLLDKAELNLTKEQKDVSKELEEYRTSLLIFKYQDELIRQKLDTVISPKEISDYYKRNSNNFILDEVVVKALYVQIPKDAPNVEKVFKLYKSDKEDDRQELEDYCYQYAKKFDYVGDEWFYWNSLLQYLPLQVERVDAQYFKRNEYIEVSDLSYHFFVHILDARFLGEVEPLSLVQQKIRTIILNKRRVQFIKNLESQVYNNAQSRDLFQIYQ